MSWNNISNNSTNNANSSTFGLPEKIVEFADKKRESIIAVYKTVIHQMKNQLFWQNKVLDQETRKELCSVIASKDTAKFTKLFEQNELYRPLFYNILKTIGVEADFSKLENERFNPPTKQYDDDDEKSPILFDEKLNAEGFDRAGNYPLNLALMIQNFSSLPLQTEGKLRAPLEIKSEFRNTNSPASEQSQSPCDLKYFDASLEALVGDYLKNIPIKHGTYQIPLSILMERLPKDLREQPNIALYLFNNVGTPIDCNFFCQIRENPT